MHHEFTSPRVETEEVRLRSEKYSFGRPNHSFAHSCRSRCHAVGGVRSRKSPSRPLSLHPVSRAQPPIHIVHRHGACLWCSAVKRPVPSHVNSLRSRERQPPASCEVSGACW